MPLSSAPECGSWRRERYGVYPPWRAGVRHLLLNTWSAAHVSRRRAPRLTAIFSDSSTPIPKNQWKIANPPSQWCALRAQIATPPVWVDTRDFSTEYRRSAWIGRCLKMPHSAPLYFRRAIVERSEIPAAPGLHPCYTLLHKCYTTLHFATPVLHLNRQLELL